MSVAASVDPILERPLVQDVRALARTGALWTVSLVVGRHAISMAATAVLSRLLSQISKTHGQKQQNMVSFRDSFTRYRYVYPFFIA